MSSDILRVAAAQFESTADTQHNLETCLRMLDTAAATGAELVVFPEFANHISVYASLEHCHEVAVDLDGPWLGAVAQRVAEHRIHLVITPTVRRSAERITVTNVLIGPGGAIVATADKATLMGNERAFLSASEAANPLADTPWGLLGLYSCMDGVTFETPRGFAVRGARLLTNSLNSFALDEAALHIPVRAAENGVFVVAANKVGALLPPDQVESFSQALGVPPDALNGAGESQIVHPSGEVLAKAPLTGEAVITANINLSDVDAYRGQLEHRRPVVYRALTKPDTTPPHANVPESVSVACAPDPGTAATLATAGIDLLVLPELTPVPQDIAQGTFVVTTAMVDGRHVGQVWTVDGLAHSQPQIHQSTRRPTALALDAGVGLLSTPFGDVALIVGDDHRYPESFRLAAIQGAHIAAVCFEPQHQWELDLALPERGAENRLCVVACAPQGHNGLGGTMVLNPPADSLWSPQRSGPYDGTINTPEAVVAAADATSLRAELFPIRATAKEISRNTDLVSGRSWQASSVLTS